MLEERNIILFDPFYFKNGNTPKPKYFVVLKKLINVSIIASLPTRKNSIPYKENIEGGCLELPDINLNCFIIPQNIEVTEGGKYFEFKTYLYGHQIEDYEISWLNVRYQNNGIDFEIWGRMKIEIFNELIQCFKIQNP